MSWRVFPALLAALLGLGLAVAPPAAAAPVSRFVEMFPSLPGFTSPAPQDIADLAQDMLDPNADSENNADMLSVYTYFGQFIDHDLTLDNTPQPSEQVNVATLPPNVRTFRFDLDSVYGGGPTGSPQLYEADGKHFRLQDPNPNGQVDLPRNADGSAILVEGRNDENEIVSQIHVAWLRVHNRLVDSGMSFAAARAETVRLYQTIVLDEVLPHFVGQQLVDDTRAGRVERFYKDGNPNGPKTPVEFSVAAYRFGHSMVRRAYEVTTTSGKVQVFSATAPDLRGGRQLPAGRQIDWGNFVDELTRPENVAHANISRKIDTLISSSLFALPIPGAEASGSNVLAFRNMTRADFYSMPSGQSVAQAMGEPVIPPSEITTRPAFQQGTPLWLYILFDAHKATDGKTLGPVGGRIVSDVFLRLLEDDPASILNEPFSPTEGRARGQFDLGDLFVFAKLAQLPT